MFSKIMLATGVAIAALTASPATAAVVVLDFERINTSYPFANSTFVNNYYNGGTSSVGTSGTNFGVGFSSNSLVVCLNSLSVSCSNASRGGLAPASATAGLFFLNGAASIMNVAAGFTTGFAFNYSAINQAGSVQVFDGLGGTGTLLGTLALPTTASNCVGYGAGFCPFRATGVAFGGTAKSVLFSGVANQIAFDDITFGSATPGGVPEPATWAMMIGGFGAIGGTMRYRRRRTSVSFG